jgi:hypothetical protein
MDTMSGSIQDDKPDISDLDFFEHANRLHRLVYGDPVLNLHRGDEVRRSDQRLSLFDSSVGSLGGDNSADFFITF